MMKYDVDSEHFWVFCWLLCGYRERTNVTRLLCVLISKCCIVYFAWMWEHGAVSQFPSTGKMTRPVLHWGWWGGRGAQGGWGQGICVRPWTASSDSVQLRLPRVDDILVNFTHGLGTKCVTMPLPSARWPLGKLPNISSLSSLICKWEYWHPLYRGVAWEKYPLICCCLKMFINLMPISYPHLFLLLV